MKQEKQKLHNALSQYLKRTLVTSSEDTEVYRKALELFRLVEKQIKMNKQEILDQLYQHKNACFQSSLTDAVAAIESAIALVEQLDEKQEPEAHWRPQPGEHICVRDYDSEGWIIRKFVKMNPNGIGVRCEGRIFGYEMSFLQYKRLEL